MDKIHFFLCLKKVVLGKKLVYYIVILKGL